MCSLWPRRESRRDSAVRITTSLIAVSLLSAATSRPAVAQICLEDQHPLLPPNLGRVIASADLDGDGFADVVLGNNSSSTISIIRSIGGSLSSSEVAYRVGGLPGSVTIADLNGDGHPDIMVANGASVSVLLNLGNGTFAQQVEYSTASGPSFVTTGDLNGDGAPDLVATIYDPGAVSVRLNQGDGSFGPESLYRAGGGARSATCADLDGDGHTDLAIANASGSISVLTNRGDGTFTPAVQYPLDHGPASITSADFDGDGSVDLAVVKTYEDSVSIFFNRGDGTFGTPEALRLNFYAAYPSTVLTADMDKDGKPDLVIAGDSWFMTVLRNRGNGSFDFPKPYAPSVYMITAAIGDIDGDGFPDVAVLGSNGLQVSYNQRDGTLAERGQYLVGRIPWCVTNADLNGDGAPDLVTTNDMMGTVSVLMNRGDGVFAPQVEYDVGASPRCVVSGDLDGDGDADLVVSNGLSLSMSVLLNRGDGTFEPQQEFMVGTAAMSLVCADLNGDGFPDLAMNGGSGTVLVLLNAGDGTFPHGARYPAGGGMVGIFAVTSGDFDGDGHLDLAAAGYNNQHSQLAVMHNQGNGRFIPAGQYGGLAAGGMTSADLNGDGHLDLVVATVSDYTASVFLNHGDGTFADAVRYPAGHQPFCIASGDLDGDGLPDLVLANFERSSVSVLRNLGQGTFGPEVEYGTGRMTLSVTVADFDGDGDLDLGVANGGQNSVSVLRNCRETGIIFCAGDGSGTACPCNNSSPLGSGAGCLDSHGVGAVLRASGSARLAHDAAILSGTNLPDGFAFYFQGSARENGGAGSAYGDGLRCAGGSLRRLGAVASAGGTSQFPRAGDAGLSTRGGVNAPGTRTYQILYRDRASFCTPDTFNLSNGVQILWTP